MQTAVLSLLSLAALVVAAVPRAQITPAPFANKRDVVQGTVTVVNSMSVALSTSIVSNEGSATLIAGGETPTGTMAPGATATMVMPMPWAGNMALALANTSDLAKGNFATLIEPSMWNYEGQDNLDIDVSYVVGYTVSAICHCNKPMAQGQTFLSGCVADLWQLATCGSDGEEWHQDLASCKNPSNDQTRNWNTTTNFFAPCENLAYTFPADDTANNGGDCKSLDITCCVGTEADGCKPADKPQPSAAGAMR